MTFDESNVELVCNDCHRESHDKQGWQAHQYLYGDVAQVSSVTFRGVEETYDLEIEGAYPNFVANGVVVHNSRNSASSRAIPVKKQIERVMSDPAMPVEWGLNQPGMQSGQLADYATVTRAKSAWLFSRDKAVSAVIELDELGIHKQWASRLLEPFMWHTVVFTTTVPGLENFFLQRCTVHSPLAQPEMRAFADAVLGAYFVSTPTPVGLGEWHTPYIQEDEEFSIELERLQVSAARCARVSYLTQDGVRDHKEDLKLFDRLVSAKPMHGSPLEHVAIPAHPTGQHRGNLEGWDQLRHILGA